MALPAGGEPEDGVEPAAGVADGAVVADDEGGEDGPLVVGEGLPIAPGGGVAAAVGEAAADAVAGRLGLGADAREHGGAGFGGGGGVGSGSGREGDVGGCHGGAAAAALNGGAEHGYGTEVKNIFLVTPKPLRWSKPQAMDLPSATVALTTTMWRTAAMKHCGELNTLPKKVDEPVVGSVRSNSKAAREGHRK
ncbi:hypothetical protein GCM10009416_05150 [Craurococcus roseus]|uniref:Uncharacterized protein n=1 Tax=Craurococcus roseus TaxID=77585 RepID=A0ABN1EM97_9PROT